MIDGLGQAKAVRTEAVRTDAVARTAAPATIRKPVAEGATTAKGPAARLAAEGPPIDSAKVDAIRAAIADGTYRIDPDAIAARMIDADLGEVR